MGDRCERYPCWLTNRKRPGRTLGRRLRGKEKKKRRKGEKRKRKEGRTV